MFCLFFSHEYLLNISGVYAGMWRQQQEKYRDEPSGGSRPEKNNRGNGDGQDGDDDDSAPGGITRPTLPAVNSAALLNGREALA